MNLLPMMSFSVDDSDDNSGYDERKHTNYNVQVRHICVAAGVFIRFNIVQKNKRKGNCQKSRTGIHSIYTDTLKIVLSF